MSFATFGPGLMLDFIELNPFPRVGLSPESAEIARRLFARHMDAIEAAAAPRSS